MIVETVEEETLAEKINNATLYTLINSVTDVAYINDKYYFYRYDGPFYSAEDLSTSPNYLNDIGGYSSYQNKIIYTNIGGDEKDPILFLCSLSALYYSYDFATFNALKTSADVLYYNWTIIEDSNGYKAFLMLKNFCAYCVYRDGDNYLYSNTAKYIKEIEAISNVAPICICAAGESYFLAFSTNAVTYFNFSTTTMGGDIIINSATTYTNNAIELDGTDDDNIYENMAYSAALGIAVICVPYEPYFAYFDGSVYANAATTVAASWRVVRWINSLNCFIAGSANFLACSYNGINWGKIDCETSFDCRNIIELNGYLIICTSTFMYYFEI